MRLRGLSLRALSSHWTDRFGTYRFGTYGFWAGGFGANRSNARRVGAHSSGTGGPGPCWRVASGSVAPEIGAPNFTSTRSQPNPPRIRREADNRSQN
jgi:hypothetical protein